MRKTVKDFLFTGLVVGFANVVLFLMLAHTADAMPNFSRRYQTSCVTCHSTYPILNPVGDAFRLNGYRFEDDEQYVKEPPTELGDEAYKKLWPNAMWPGEIPNNSGFSAGARMYAEVDVGDESDTRESNVSFIFPHEAELAWAGNLGEGLSAYGDMIFVQEDYGSKDTVSWLMAKAWIELADLVGPENAVNLRVGSLGMHTIGLYTSKDEQRMGLQYYIINSWALPDIKLEKSPGLVAFTGNTFTHQPQLGVEVSGFGKSWLYYVGVVNGNIDRDPGDVYFMGVGKNTDTKDYYGGFAWKIGGMGFDGTNAKTDNPLSNAEYWRDDSLTLSVFGYTGTARIEVEYDDPAQTVTQSDDDFWRLSIGARERYRDLTLLVGYQWAHDDNPYGTLWNNDMDATVWFVEAQYFVYPWLIPYARYEELDFDNIPVTAQGDPVLIEDKQDINVATFGVKAHLRANVHITAEYQDVVDRDFVSATDEVAYLQLMFFF